jgi:hypothetical protein
VFAALAGSASSLLAGGEFSASPSINLQSTYDQNTFFQGEAGLETRISPSLDLRYRQERSNLSINLSADHFEYIENRDFNRTNQRYSAAYGRSLSPVVSGNISGSVQIRSNLETEQEENNIIVGDESTTYIYQVGTGLNWVVSSKDSLGISLSYNTRENENNEEADRDGYSAGFSWGRTLTQRTTLNMQTSVSVSKSETRQDDVLTTRVVEIAGDNLVQGLVAGDSVTEGTQTTLSGSLGLSHRLTEKTTLSFSAGPRYSISDFTGEFTSSDGTTAVPVGVDAEGNVVFGAFNIVDLPDEETEENNLGYIFSGSINTIGERYSVGLTAGRSFISTNLGENVNRNNVALSFSYRLTEFLTTVSGLSYTESKTEDIIVEQEQNSKNFSQRLNWRAGEKLSIFAAYNYSATRNEISDEFSNRSRYSVGLSYRFPEYRD